MQLERIENQRVLLLPATLQSIAVDHLVNTAVSAYEETRLVYRKTLSEVAVSYGFATNISDILGTGSYNTVRNIWVSTVDEPSHMDNKEILNYAFML
jgi:hypothetical protein